MQSTDNPCKRGCGTRQTRLVAGVFLLFLCSGLAAQPPVPKRSLDLAYFGNTIWNPGLSGGLEYTKNLKQKSGRKDDLLTLQNFYSVDLAFYTDPGSHSALLFQAGLNRRMLREKGPDLHFGFSPVGLSRTFLPESYELNADGEVVRVRLPGRLYFAPGLQLGTGNPLPGFPGADWFADINLTALMPYNTYVMFLVNLKLGLRISLS